MNIESRRIVKVLALLSGLFISLMLYLSFFQLVKADEVREHSYNKRRWIGEEEILRGKITDRNGEVLAYSQKEGNTQIRHYSYGSLYAHIIGYSYREYGKAGLESTYNQELLNLKDSNPIEQLKDILKSGKEQYGNDLVLTIDNRLQKRAYELLGENKGSIVLMSPKTGEIYAMASNPTFNPSELRQNWKTIVESEESYLLNRATMGLYAPGSIFKVITATAALENPHIDTNYNCNGSIKIDGYVINNYGKKPHGKVNLESALVKSTNTAFAQIGVKVGEETLREVAENYILNNLIPFDLKTYNSSFSKQIKDDAELAATSIGQGKTLVTPLNMAMVASAIANHGEMVKPILVKRVESSEGRIERENYTEILSITSSSMITQEIKNMMVSAVNNGTGQNAKIRNIKVAGKTGTAENETDKSHAWFIGFAPADNPEVAIAVILEQSGSTGGSVAAPIARNLFIDAINILK